MSTQWTYLGDGLEVRHDGFQYLLKTERDNGVNWVALDEISVLPNFLAFIERTAGVKINITKATEEP